ncbi:MAG: hypothetical protein RR213_07260 [Raoultibacter sp.]
MEVIEKYYVSSRLEDDPYRRHSLYAFQGFIDGTTSKDQFFKMYGEEAMLMFREYLDDEDFALLEKERNQFLSEGQPAQGLMPNQILS